MANGDQFEILRRRAKQRSATEAGESQQAIRRRFAALGSLSSGAAIKQEQLAGEAVRRRGEESIQNIDFAEQQELQRRKEIGEAREFQAGESRLGREAIAGESALSRAFAGEQAGIQRGFQSKESELGRGFQAGESALGRGFVAGESRLDRAERAATLASQQGFASQQQKDNIEANLVLATKNDTLQRELAAATNDIQKEQIKAQLDINEANINSAELMNQNGLNAAVISQDKNLKAQTEQNLVVNALNESKFNFSQVMALDEFNANVVTNFINLGALIDPENVVAGIKIAATMFKNIPPEISKRFLNIKPPSFNSIDAVGPVTLGGGGGGGGETDLFGRPKLETVSPR